MAGRGGPGSARRLGAVGVSLLLLLLLLPSQEIPADSIDPAAIDLAPLVNTLINSTQSGPLQLFSLLSVTSYSSLELHKLTLLIYNISSVSVESKLFQRRFCYCVSNKTNDLTDFTAILLDVMSNSSYLHEIFKSTSILSVSQKNDTDCIYICVMAGQTDREFPQLWDSALITPLFNQTIIEDPHRSGNLSFHHSSSAWQQWPTNVSQTSPSGPSGALTSRVHVQDSTTTAVLDQIPSSSSAGDAATTPPHGPPPPTPPAPSLTTTHTRITDRLITTTAAVGSTETATDTGTTPVSMTTTATTTPTSEQRGITTKQPTPTTASPITTERSTLAPPLSTVTSSQTAFTSPPTGRPGQLTAAGMPPATPQKTTTTTDKETTNTQQVSTTVHQIHTSTLRAPQGSTTRAAPTVAVQQEMTSSPGRTSVVHLLPVGVPVDSTTRPTTEKPGCLWRRPSDPLGPAGPTGPWTPLGVHKLQPCLLELCKFFSLCLCRPHPSKTPPKRYCADSDLWYRSHTPELCSRLKRISFSRNLKQRCLARMCGRP